METEESVCWEGGGLSEEKRVVVEIQICSEIGDGWHAVCVFWEGYGCGKENETGCLGYE